MSFSLRYDEEVGPLSPLAVSLAAGFSGSVAAASSHGFDNAKSRSQCIVLPKVFLLLGVALSLMIVITYGFVHPNYLYHQLSS